MKRLGVSHLIESEEAATSFFDKLGLLDVTDDQIRLKIRDVFAYLDTDGSGFLDQQELAEALGSFDMSMSAGDVLTFLDARPDDSGVSGMSYAEFEALVLTVRERTLSTSSRTRGTTASMDQTAPVDTLHSTSLVSAEGSRATVSIHDEVATATADTGSSSTSRGSGSSSSSSSPEWSGDDDVPAAIEADLKRPAQRNRLRSARSTNRYADDMLHRRLERVERALERCVAGEGRAVRRLFAAAAREGRISYVAAGMEYAAGRALYSGGVDAAGRPDGVGCLDYAGFPRRGSVTGERRVYYAGCMEGGVRQGAGLLRWIDGTEYAGTWHADAPHGAGVETYGDGSWFAGGFAGDKRHGMGAPPAHACGL